MTGNGKKKTKRLISKKLFKLDKKNEKEIKKIELNLLALENMLKKSDKDNKYYGRKKNF